MPLGFVAVNKLRLSMMGEPGAKCAIAATNQLASERLGVPLPPESVAFLAQADEAWAI